MLDPFNLQRFVEAQTSVFTDVCTELRRGRKQSHWMWFIFPQIQGLGHSSLARKYAISGLTEAEAYLQHPVLGPRLQECTQLVNSVEGKTILEILGEPDNLKFRSCVTLFGHAAPAERVFSKALKKYFDGKPDPSTLALL